MSAAAIVIGVVTLTLGGAGVYAAYRVVMGIEVRRTLEIEHWDTRYAQWFRDALRAEVRRMKAAHPIRREHSPRWRHLRGRR